MHRTGVHHNWDFHRALVERGWLAPGWPEEFGGQGRDPLEMLAFAEEFHRAGAPTYAVGTTLMVANIIRQIGTDEQKRLVLPPALGGEIIIVLGFTEPESGSDVAAAQTRAVQDGDEWVVNGQKMFTTNAQEADYVFMLTRTDPDLPKHQGLTTFLVPLRQPGVEIQPVYTLSGERTNLTFYSDVRVPDSLRIGAVSGGWDVMKVGLTLERAGDQGGESIRLLTTTEEWVRDAADEDGNPLVADRHVRARLGRAAAENEVTTLLCRRCAWIHESGGSPGVEGSMSKLFASEALTRQSADFVDLLGRDGIRSLGDPSAQAGGLRTTPSVSPWARRPTAGPAKSSATSSPNGGWGCPGHAEAAPGRRPLRRGHLEGQQIGGQDDGAAEMRGGLVDPVLFRPRCRRRHEMGENKRSDVCPLRCLRRVRNRRVVVEHIGEPGQPELLDEIPPHHGVDEHVGPVAQLVKGGAGHGVPGHDHRPASVVDAEAHRGPDRRMIGGRRRHPNRSILEDLAPFDLGHHRGRSPAQVFVVSHAIADIGFEHLLGRLQEPGCPPGSEHHQRVRLKRHGPAHGEEVVEVGDVVAVEMGEKQGPDRAPCRRRRRPLASRHPCHSRPGDLPRMCGPGSTARLGRGRAAGCHCPG